MHLEIANLVAGYGRDFDVLRGVSLEARPGQFVGLIGPNGAGKSTLMQTICGFNRPRAGTMTLDGRSIATLGTQEIAAHGIGYLMEGHSVFPAMSVEENLKLGLVARRGTGMANRQAIEQVYHRSPVLAEKRKLAAGLLSGGQQRILKLERLALAEPSLILLDEPSIGLSPKLAGEMLDRARRYREAGATVLLVDQNARRLAEICDYLYVLQLGSIVRQGTGASLLPEIETIVRDFI